MTSRDEMAAQQELIKTVIRLLGDKEYASTQTVTKVVMEDGYVENWMKACSLKKGDMKIILGKVAALNKGLFSRNERTVADAKKRKKTFIQELPMAIMIPGSTGFSFKT